MYFVPLTDPEIEARFPTAYPIAFYAVNPDRVLAVFEDRSQKVVSLTAEGFYQTEGELYHRLSEDALRARFPWAVAILGLKPQFPTDPHADRPETQPEDEPW